MTEFDAFDRKLAAALTRYASEAPTDVDAAALARSVVVRSPRSALRGLRFSGTPLAWAAVSALLVLGALLTVVVVGAIVRWAAPQDPPSVIPDRLFGRWQADVGSPDATIRGTYVLHLDGPTLLELSGQPRAWAGRVVSFEPSGSTTGELVVESEACGVGRYTIVEREPVPFIREAPDDRLHRQESGRSLGFANPRDPCRERVVILTEGPWSRPSKVDLDPGVRYDSLDFTEPFTFTNPAWDPTVPRPAERHWGWGGLRIGNGYSWSSTLHDDQPVSADICNPGGRQLPDVPATPEAVGEWLRSGSGIEVAPAIPIQVDGRTALRYDVTLAEACRTFEAPLEPPSFTLSFRVYAIPTGDDTIIYVLWSDEGSFPPIATSADVFVRSIDFR